MAKQSITEYNKKYPFGVQTVVKDNLQFQVNTRTPDGWWISKSIRSCDVKKELNRQAVKFLTTYQQPVLSKPRFAP